MHAESVVGNEGLLEDTGYVRGAVHSGLDASLIVALLGAELGYEGMLDGGPVWRDEGRREEGVGACASVLPTTWVIRDEQLDSIDEGRPVVPQVGMDGDCVGSVREEQTKQRQDILETG